MFDPRITLQQQVSEQLKGPLWRQGVQHRDSPQRALGRSPSYGLPGVVFDPLPRGSHAFVDFAKEMVDRVKRMGIAVKRPQGLDKRKQL